jgi:hypothetical protein
MIITTRLGVLANFLPRPVKRQRSGVGQYEVEDMGEESRNSEIFKRFVLVYMAFVIAIVWFIPQQLTVALALVMMIEGSALWLLPIFTQKPTHDEWT